MGLLDDAVSIADQVTDALELKATVSHQSFMSADGAGNRLPGPVVFRKALVNKKQQLVKAATGEMVMSQASVTFLSPVIVTLYDRIILPDGTTGPILNTEGFVTNINPIMSEVYLG